MKDSSLVKSSFPDLLSPNTRFIVPLLWALTRLCSPHTLTHLKARWNKNNKGARQDASESRRSGCLEYPNSTWKGESRTDWIDGPGWAPSLESDFCGNPTFKRPISSGNPHHLNFYINGKSFLLISSDNCLRLQYYEFVMRIVTPWLALSICMARWKENEFDLLAGHLSAMIVFYILCRLMCSDRFPHCVRNCLRCGLTKPNEEGHQDRQKLA